MVVNVKVFLYFWGLNFKFEKIQLFIICEVGGSRTFVQSILT